MFQSLLGFGKFVQFLLYKIGFILKTLRPEFVVVVVVIVVEVLAVVG